MEVTSVSDGSSSFTAPDATGLNQLSPLDENHLDQTDNALITMTFDRLHQEEAQQTDHDRSFQELTGIAPPCSDCGKHERVDGDLCRECSQD